MIGIKVNGNYLDLGPSPSTQTERNTPFLLGEEILGEFSYPFSIPATENNLVTLGFLTELGAAKKAKVEAEYEEYNVLLYKGTLVAEFMQIELNNPSKSSISVYFLTAISSFYSMARDTRLQDLPLGEFTIYDFPSHFRATLSGNADIFPYVFAPMMNNGYIPEQEGDVLTSLDKFMNPVLYVTEGIIPSPSIPGMRSVMPFIYYRHLLTSAFTFFGYTVEGEILQDADFKKAFLPNFNAISWSVDIGNPLPTPKNPVYFNLSNHVPRDYPVTSFLLQFANFFGISFNIDTTKKHCVITPLNKFLSQSRRVDMTSKINPSIKVKLEKNAKIYSLKLNFDPADQRISKPDLSNLIRIPDVANEAALPPASVANENRYTLAINTNWFFVCRYDTESHDYVWTYLADNIYDYEPEGSNQTIETAITPVSQSVAKYYQTGSTVHEVLIAAVDQEGNWPGKEGSFVNWELRIAFYHGLRQGIDGYTYPFSSSHNRLYNGTKIAQYSLSLNTADGILATFWKKWIKMLQTVESIELILYLNQREIRDLRWNDIILIRNIPYLLTKITPSSPYRDICPCEAMRIDLTVQPPTPCNSTVGGIFVVDTRNGGANVSFAIETPGASQWKWEVYDYAGTTMYQEGTTATNSFNITSLGGGSYLLKITPYCGSVPGANTADKPFTLLPPMRVQLTAVKVGAGSLRKFRITATPVDDPWFINIFSFRFGQCMSQSAGSFCNGYPGAPYNPALFATVTGGYMNPSAYADSAANGAPDAVITKLVLHNLVGITPSQIIKAPGQTWDLEFA